MIINSHMHLGDCRATDHLITEEEIINCMDKNNIDASVVFPFPWPKDHKKIHARIAEMQKKHPNRIFGLIDINPHIDENSYYQEVEIFVKEYCFVGIKLHPLFHACPVNAKDSDKVFAAARDYNIPLMIHSGLGAPLALPSLFIPRAKQFPSLTIICAHAGAYIHTAEAILLAHECPNVILETSWCAPHRIKQMIDELGADRVMMGSDLVSNIATEITKYKTIGLSEKEMWQGLAGTAIEVFKLPL